MPFKTEQIQLAIDHLRSVDPIMNRLIDQAGPFTLKLNPNRFGMLVRSILSQQISTKAARAIRLRLETLLQPDGLLAEAIVRATDQQLKSVGLSGQKVGYLRDLCERKLDGRLRLDRIGRLDDEQAIEHLVQVKGIGRWTAQMFLMFSLGRLDVYPHDDFGVRNAIRELYGLAEMPSKTEGHRISEPWGPYRSIGSWYCWRWFDVKNAARQDASQYPV